MNDDLGDRLQRYEAVSTSRRAFKGQPLIVRLDGRGFHTFTKGLKRPYDERLSGMMVRTMIHLVDHFNMTVGYTQSDEITLALLSEPHDPGELLFDGRLQKIESLTAASASVFFNSLLPVQLPEKIGAMPIFDSRAFVTPNLQEAYHEFLWRQQDATKNAISMAAQSMFKHKELQGKHGPEMQEMMFQKGTNFNDYPYFFKRGTFCKRVERRRELTTEDFERIPEAYWPKEGYFMRSVIEPMDIWLTKQEDKLGVLFGDVEPVAVA